MLCRSKVAISNIKPFFRFRRAWFSMLPRRDGLRLLYFFALDRSDFSFIVTINFTGGFALRIGLDVKVCGGNIVYDNDMVFVLHKETVFTIA
jgi:hypothetical protein